MKRRYALLRPFSHQPGSSCLLPGSSSVVTLYPSLIVIRDSESNEIVKEIPFGTKRRESTLIQDLETGAILCKNEVDRLRIGPSSVLCSERLCLGVYKKQEVEHIRRRRSLAEIFPLLFRLGNQLAHEAKGESRSVFSLLEACKRVERPEEIAPAFKDLYLAGFSSFLLPQKEDPACYNLYRHEPITTPILALLSETAFWIRSLFFVAKENTLHFLPKRPPEAVYGRMYDIAFSYGKVDFTWSKKQLRTLTLTCEKEGEVELVLPSALKRYRLRNSKTEWKMEAKTKLELSKGERYYFDRFEK